jgi:hypothetical protein
MLMAKSSVRPKKKATPPQRRRLPDDFVSVARRLECDEDKATFEAKLTKIAKHRPAEKQANAVKPRQ